MAPSNRNQYRFFDAECGPGSDTTCTAELRYKDLTGEFPNGYWDGDEDKDLRTEYNPDRVYGDSDTMTYQGELINGTYYKCPTHVQDGILYLECDNFDRFYIDPYHEEFIVEPDPPDPNNPTRRVGQDTGNNYYCIAFGSI